MMVIIPFSCGFRPGLEKKMEYQEFKNMIQERLQAMMGESVEVKIESYYKNNQTKVESLTFKEKNPVSKIIFSPAIHLQDIYRLYILHGDGEELADCPRQVFSAFGGVLRPVEVYPECNEKYLIYPIISQKEDGDKKILSYTYYCIDLQTMEKRNRVRKYWRKEAG